MPLNDSNKKHGREFPLFPPYHITCLIKSDFQPKLIRLQANALPADNCSINRMSIEKSEKKTPVAFVSLMEMQLYSFFARLAIHIMNIKMFLFNFLFFTL